MPDSVEKNDTTKPKQPVRAHGKPGSKPHWSASSKTAVGTAISGMSHIWFTLRKGILNEIYFPDIDKANTRTVRFLVTDENGYYSDEEKDAEHTCVAHAPGVPAYTLTSKSLDGRYRLTKEIVAESVRDTLLCRVHFEVLDGTKLKLFIFLEPHLADQGGGNGAWVGQYKGETMLLAGRDQSFLACMCTVPWAATTCGYQGENDAYEQLKKSGKLTAIYNEAPTGNVFLCGEIAVPDDGRFIAAISLGSGPAETAQIARAASMANFDQTWQEYVKGWEDQNKKYLPLKTPEGSAHDMVPISNTVMRVHESARFPGAFVASLSLPWGASRSDKDTGAYHVLWPRDLCMTAMGLMAAGCTESGCRALFYLACTQEADGSWPQNMWLDGTLHWGAIQMDGIAMPVILADRLRRMGELGTFDAWPMVRKAVTYLLKNGPFTQQERWEALAGYASFTMACEISALLAGADFADANNDKALADFLRITADAWNDMLDTVVYAEGTALAKKHGVPGYYLRITPAKAITEPDLNSIWLHEENHLPLGGYHHAVNVVSPDALALTRFGLRAADDPRMIATAKVIDAELKYDLKTGPGWTRSTDDGYGEHKDGAPYDGHGIGRCWPLLAGERGHYELARGNKEFAEDLSRVMSRQTSECGMLPEQVWNAEDIPEHELYNGHPAGSAMPLAWAHAEYVKLVRSMTDGDIWDTPPQCVQRYQKEKHVAPYEIWTEKAQRTWVSTGKYVRMDFEQPVSVSATVDDAPAVEYRTGPPQLDLHSLVVELPKEWKQLTVDYTDANGKAHTLKLKPR